MKDNLLKFFIILVVAVTCLSISFYFLIILPKQEQAVLHLEQQQAADATAALQKCLNLAESDYLFVQDSLCLQDGKKAGCSEFIGSPKDVEFTKVKDNEKQLCLDTYKASLEPK